MGGHTSKSVGDAGFVFRKGAASDTTGRRLGAMGICRAGVSEGSSEEFCDKGA